MGRKITPKTFVKREVRKNVRKSVPGGKKTLQAVGIAKAIQRLFK